MSKALIKKTGEILDIKFHYKTLSFSIDVGESKSKKTKKETWVFSGEEYNIEEKPNKSEPYYVLSNGEQYSEDEVVVGTDEIRDWKIKNIVNDDENK